MRKVLVEIPRAAAWECCLHVVPLCPRAGLTPPKCQSTTVSPAHYHSRRRPCLLHRCHLHRSSAYLSGSSLYSVQTAACRCAPMDPSIGLSFAAQTSSMSWVQPRLDQFAQRITRLRAAVSAVPVQTDFCQLAGQRYQLMSATRLKCQRYLPT